MTNRWAFLVGVNRYSDPNFGTLKFGVNDVLMLEQILTQLGYTVNCLHDDLDRDSPKFPTRDNVEARLIELCQAVQPDDLLWVHFACHGTRVERERNKKEPVLITRDTQQSLLKKRALSVAEVEKMMRDSGARQLILTLDACHSGVDIGRDLSDPEFIKNVYDLAEGFALIAASTAEQKSFEWQEKQHGVFTYYLREGLSGKADFSGKNYVTVDNLKLYVLGALRRWNVQHSLTQEPTARTEGLGDMLLADYRKYSKPPEIQIKVSESQTESGGQPKARNNSTLNHLSRTVAIRINSFILRIHKLEEQVNEVYKEIDTEGNYEKRLLLERRANDIWEEMEKIEREINQMNGLN
ncbi:MAG: caspase family protein [Xenococcus sp. (in: cyanobacteria)]